MSQPTLEAPVAPLTRLAARLAMCRWDVLDAPTRDAARVRLFDTLGACVVGLATPEGELLRRYAEVASGDGRALGVGERCRLYVGATRATEIDDIDIGSCTTVGSVVVPVALAVATAPRSHTSRALLAAIVAGYEAMMRLGRAIGGATLIYQGVWPTYVCAAFAAAATTARLLDLDASDTARALALALQRTAPLRGVMPFGLRYYALGCAAAEGADAAFAAAAGVAADGDALAGFGERCGVHVEHAQLAGTEEGPWLVHDVDSKTWPTSRQALAGVAAFRSLAVTADDLESIERIDVYVPAPYRDMVNRADPPRQRIESMIGVQYQLALAVHAPSSLLDVLRSSLPRDDAVLRTMRKVAVHADEALSRRFPQRWGARVTLEYVSGEARVAELLEPDGSAPRPFDLGGIRDKYARIFSASGVGRQGWLGVTRTRCEQSGRQPDDVSFATDMLASIG